MDPLPRSDKGPFHIYSLVLLQAATGGGRGFELHSLFLYSDTTRPFPSFGLVQASFEPNLYLCKYLSVSQRWPCLYTEKCPTGTFRLP